MELFSVLIANYNNSRFLKDAISSVLQQSYANWEIILVDDGSFDEFEEAIKPYITDNRIQIFRNKHNLGCGFTKRRCISVAHGEIAGFLDPDDTLHPDALEIMCATHRQNPGCSIIHSTHFICDDQLQVSRIAEYPRSIPENESYLLRSDGSIHAFATFKKSCYDKTIGLSGKNLKGVDQDLYYLLEETGKVLFIDQPLYYYRIHPGSISTSGNEHDATFWHYKIIQNACLRRISNLDPKNPRDKSWQRKYLMRYFKIRFLYLFRRKRWVRGTGTLFKYILVGGGGNVIHYLKKLPRERMNLVKKSFVTNYEIKP